MLYKYHMDDIILLLDYDQSGLCCFSDSCFSVNFKMLVNLVVLFSHWNDRVQILMHDVWKHTQLFDSIPWAAS